MYPARHISQLRQKHGSWQELSGVVVLQPWTDWVGKCVKIWNHNRNTYTENKSAAPLFPLYVRSIEFFFRYIWCISFAHLAFLVFFFKLFLTLFSWVGFFCWRGGPYRLQSEFSNKSNLHNHLPVAIITKRKINTTLNRSNRKTTETPEIVAFSFNFVVLHCHV